MGTSMVFGFFLTSRFITKINQEASLSDSESEEELDQYSFLEEMDNEPMSHLSEEELKNLKNNPVVLSLHPLLKQTIRMYYDYENDSFPYYSERDTIYKYLDIVARHYVIENHCKQIYVELKSSEENLVSGTSTEISGPFVSKRNETKKTYDKKLIRFVYNGNENDYQEKLRKETNRSINNMNILDFLKMNTKFEDKRDERDSDEYETIIKED
jgi:hypothetical protein